MSPAIDEDLNLAELAQAHFNGHAAPPPEEPGVLDGIRNGKHLQDLHPRPLRYAIAGIFPEGFNVLAGAPKRGKSWLALDACLAVAAGGKAFGAVDVAPGKALYLALEDSERRLQSRTRHLLGEGQEFPPDLDYLTTLPSPGVLLYLLTTYCEQNPDTRLIVIDTLARVRPAQPKHAPTYEWDYMIGKQLKAVADLHGIALVAVTHTRQMAASDFVEAVTGTSGLTGAADTIVVLDRARGKDDAMLKVTGRDVDEREYGMRMAGGAWQLLDRPPIDASLSDRTVAILDFLTLHPEGVSSKSVAEAVDMPIQQVYVYLARLRDAERIGQPARGLYTPVSSVSSLGPNLTTNTTNTKGSRGTACPDCGNGWDTVGHEVNCVDGR